MGCQRIIGWLLPFPRSISHSVFQLLFTKRKISSNFLFCCTLNWTCRHTMIMVLPCHCHVIYSCHYHIISCAVIAIFITVIIIITPSRWFKFKAVSALLSPQDWAKKFEARRFTAAPNSLSIFFSKMMDWKFIIIIVIIVIKSVKSDLKVVSTREVRNGTTLKDLGPTSQKGFFFFIPLHHSIYSIDNFERFWSVKSKCFFHSIAPFYLFYWQE